MSEPFGYIYKITNDINDKVYIGETTRSLEIRFNEHCFDSRSTSNIHNAIQKYGWQHFKIEEIEQVPLSQLYEREAYWVNYYDSYNNGYNGTKDGHAAPDWENHRKHYQNVHVLEPNLYFDSVEQMGSLMGSITSWGVRFCQAKIREALEKNIPFFDYHLEYVRVSSAQISSIDEQENWIKNLNIQYAGKHIYCPELNKEFNTVGEAAKYLLDNNYYIGNSKCPIQAIVNIIGNNLKNKTENTSFKQPLNFEQLPGSTKNTGAINNAFQGMKIYCPELKKEFNSQIEAAHYMVDNKYWNKIKLKTAKLRISDIINGIFSNYKGYSFIKL